MTDRDGPYLLISPKGGIAFKYDYRFNGRRESVTLIATTATALAYDPADRLYSSSAAGVRFAYAGVQLVGAYDSAGALLARHVPGPGLDQTVTTYFGAGVGTRQWLLANERQSVINLVCGWGVRSPPSRRKWGRTLL